MGSWEESDRRVEGESREETGDTDEEERWRRRVEESRGSDTEISGSKTLFRVWWFPDVAGLLVYLSFSLLSHSFPYQVSLLHETHRSSVRHTGQMGHMGCVEMGLLRTIGNGRMEVWSPNRRSPGECSADCVFSSLVLPQQSDNVRAVHVCLCYAVWACLVGSYV